MPRLSLIARTLPRLGLRNVARVGTYRLRLKAGWRPQPLQSECPRGAVFAPRPPVSADAKLPLPATLAIFGWHETLLSAPPDWHADPFGNLPRLHPDQDWVQALDALDGNDVKPYWELSRFYWLPQFALEARNGDKDAAARIEQWLQDWITSNPPFSGINWACGQEAAIRLLNLALTALILNTWRTPSPTLKWLVETHVRRILPTLSYALGQDNNHGTTEACALFIAGTWGRQWSMPGAAKFARTGHKWMNNRALRMIQPDGSPCQYSTTYHRANLEVLCISELWAMRTGELGLTADASQRAVDGARWLHGIIDPVSGDAPNLGSNDSSHLFNVCQSPYRDFRPTVSLAAALFDNARPWENYSDARLAALEIDPSTATWAPASSFSCEDGGFHVLRRDRSFVLMNYPQFRYRPCQADALHLDFWHNGINLLRDAGTYSYSARSADWFSGTSAHNTITFDGRDQMPRLGRFLFGQWLKAKDVEGVRNDGTTVSAAAAYSDAKGAYHKRTVTLTTESLTCRDTVSGKFEEAVLRWRLAPGKWSYNGNTLEREQYVISIEADGKACRPTLEVAAESLYYQKKSEVPVATVSVRKPTTLITKVIF